MKCCFDYDDRQELVGMIHDMFRQACYADGRYHHFCMQPYRSVQKFLIEEGVITKDECENV